jgi:hypothetical protein
MKLYKINGDLVYREEDNNFFSLKNMEIYQLDELSSIIIKKIFCYETFSYSQFEDIYTSIEGIDIDYCKEFFDFMIEKGILIHA